MPKAKATKVADLPESPPLMLNDRERAAIAEYLRAHLRIEVSVRSTGSYDSRGHDLKVRLLLEEEEISASEDWIEVQSRDTSENWRGPFGD